MNFGQACKTCAELKDKGFKIRQIKQTLYKRGYKPQRLKSALDIGDHSITVMASKWRHGYYNDDGTPITKKTTAKKTRRRRRRRATSNNNQRTDTSSLVSVLEDVLSSNLSSDNKELLVRSLISN